MPAVLSSLWSAVKALGSAVDSAVPVAVGDRTKIAAVLYSVVPVVLKVLGWLGHAVAVAYPTAAPLVAALGSVVQASQPVLAALVPLFAAAGLVRGK
jgi:hypothetical protein